MQQDIAKRLGVHVESLKNWVRGVGSPLIRHIPKIIALLGFDPVPEPETLPKRIAYLRRLIGFTQEDLAKALVVNPVTIYFWEKGLTVPSAKKLARLQTLAPSARGLIRQ